MISEKVENKLAKTCVQGGCVNLSQWEWWKNDKNGEIVQREAV